MTTLNEVSNRAIILAYKENTDLLASVLKGQGFETRVQRPVYSEQELTYSSQSRTFLNHVEAWKSIAAAGGDGYTLVCEADFVPCEGFGGFEVFWPLENRRAYGYLYYGSFRLIGLIGQKPFLRAHVAPLVCYAVNAETASIFLQYAEEVIGKEDLRQYFSFETWLQWSVMGKGAEAYIPAVHYGEHGGFPNREHRTVGALSFGGEHHADNLAGPLAFLPQYAHGSQLKYVWVRLKYHLMGWARLFTKRYFAATNVYPDDAATLRRAFFVCLNRLLPSRKSVRGA